MKKVIKLALLFALAAAFAFTMTACGGGAGDTGQLKFTGKAKDGSTVEIEIIGSGRAAAPKKGDGYVIKRNGKEISRGNIDIDGETVTFTSDSEDVFNASLYKGSMPMPVVPNGNTPVIGTISSDAGWEVGAKKELNVTAANFDSTFKSISNTPGEYVLNLTGNLIDYQGIKFDNPAVKITVRGTGSNYISWNRVAASPAGLFEVGSGYLVIENIELKYGTGGSSIDQGLLMTDRGMLEIGTGAKLTGNSKNNGAVVTGSGGLIMTGGEITNCRDGLVVDYGASITVTGGIISNSAAKGIWVGKYNCAVIITGGEIKNNHIGLEINGPGNSIFVSNATFSGNDIKAIGIDILNSPNTKRNLIVLSDGAVISDSNESGVNLEGRNNIFKMTGGVIKGCKHNGLVIKGSGCIFEKTGGIIYGTSAGANTNTNGAIIVYSPTNTNLLKKTSDAIDTENLAATLNSAGTAIASKSGSWD